MLRLTTLGAVDLRDRLGHVVRDVLSQPKRLALLVYLAVESRRGPVSRDRVVALFWPESDTERARNALSQSLHHIRQAVGTEAVESHGSASVQVMTGALWCDAVAFGEALERGEGELALDLYRGEFCPSLFVSGAPDVERWLDEQRARLRGQAIAGSRTLAEHLLGRGDTGSAGRVARRALAMHPDDEGEVRSLLSLLDRCGDSAGALQAYQEYQRRLAHELETEPDPDTTRLVEAMRRRRESAANAAPGASVPEVAVDAGRAPATEATPQRQAPRRRMAASLVAAAVLLVTLGMGAFIATRRTRAATPPSVKTIMVFPFTVRGASLGYLHEGMVDLLSAKLDGTSGFHAIDPRSVMAGIGARNMTGADAYQSLARRLGAGWYVAGDVVEIAGRIQLSGALFEPGAGTRPVATATVSGDTTHLFELVDNLTGRILAGLMPGRDTMITRLAALTTPSLPALKAFLAGEQAMRAGRDGEAATSFREAVALDSTFALAEYRLALAATWIQVPGITSLGDITEMATRAERNAHRLTPLMRDLLAGYAAYKAVHIDESERAFRRITEAHPDNVEAWFQLAETHFHYNPIRGRSPEESRADFQRVLSLDPGNAHALIHLARLAARNGPLAELDSTARGFLERYHGAERTMELRTLLATAHDDRQAFQAVMHDASATDLVVLESMLQATLAWGQNPALGRDFALMLTRLPAQLNSYQYSRRQIATMTLAMGQWSREAALSALRDRTTTDSWLESAALLAANPMVPLTRARVSELRDSVRARAVYPTLERPGFPPPFTAGEEVQAFIVGLLSVRLDDSLAVQHSLATLAAAPAGPRADIATFLARSLRAETARHQGDLRRALAELNGLPELLPGEVHLGSWLSHERFLMAELLRGLGREDEALDCYDSYPAGFDIPWVALAHLRQAQIYERKGNRERAVFHYQRFVRFWEHADPDLQPMVADARAALARLGDVAMRPAAP